MSSTIVTGKYSRRRDRIAICDNIDEELSPSPRSTQSTKFPELSISQLRRLRNNVPIAYSVHSGESRREPRRNTVSSTNTTPRRSMESDASYQQRDTATVPPHSDEQPTLRYGESQTPNTESLDCGEVSSGSEDGLLPNKPSRDPRAYLKYLVRGFLRRRRATTSSDDEGRITFPDKHTFVPSPKITFLIDEPDNLICQVCQQAPLMMAITAECAGPESTAILPCGHVFCLGCIDVWLASHASCPFCRTSMTHAECGHQVQPRLIAQDTIHTLPETLANGGKIGRICFKCNERDRKEMSVLRWTELAQKFKTARRQAELLGTDEAVKEMRKVQKAFERVAEDDYWVLSTRRHHQW